MAKVRLFGGKPLIVGGKIALNDNCCCGQPPSECTCTLPAIECPHVLCFEFNAATKALDGGYYDPGALSYFSDDGINTIFNIVPFFFNGVASVFVTGTSLEIDVAMSVTDFFDHWHGVSFGMDGSGGLFLCAYGRRQSGFLTARKNPFIELFIGSAFASPGPVDVQIRNIKLLANPDSAEQDFIFPTDSFSSTVGSGQSISGGTVRVQNTGSGVYGYLKTLTPPYNTTNCINHGNCENACPPFGDIVRQINATGTYNIAGNDYLLAVDATPTWNIENADCIGRVTQPVFNINYPCSPSGPYEEVPVQFFCQVIPVITGSGNNCAISSWTLQGAVVEATNALVCNSIFPGACATSEFFGTPTNVFNTHFYDCVGPNICVICPTLGQANWNIYVSNIANV